MIKKVLYILGLALISQLIVACVNCNCPPTRNIYFTNKALSLKNMDKSLPDSMVTNSRIISNANYGIQVRLQTTLLTMRKQQLNWGLMQTAYACSCNDDNFIAKERVVSLKIVSNNDFDASHPKNTDLTLYFKARKGVTMISIADYIKTANELGYDTMYPFYEGVFLQAAPSINKKHQFKLTITLSDGRILEAETTEVELA
ncbi:DUF5034 domain-containing protein [Pedobacter sp. GSP4]|uniref:DUF5034 domain-containing protein n=1 Tax=Pedobacter sp. GSP4 TaxID=3453716 RepID=UPI003EEDB7B5